MAVDVRSGSPTSVRDPRAWALVLVLLGAWIIPLASPRSVDAAAVDHLVVSEVVTGGSSASDELIELYNPTPAALPLEGLEVIYVSASGATISRRTSWALGAPAVVPGGHLLIANEAGIYAPIADALYASGMASTGGSVAIRIQGAGSSIDAVGWGTSTSTWREGTAVTAPAAGSSVERLPGGAAGSTQDTDDNAADFAQRLVPEPQNVASPPTPAPGTDPTPTPIPPEPTPIPPDPTPVPPDPTPAPEPSVTIAEARAAADGTTVTIEGVALAGSDFHDGGGFVADATGGIAVLVTDGTFARGALLRVTGEVDDRFAQRTLRADGPNVVALGDGASPAPTAASTGAIAEAAEGRLVRIAGTISGSSTTLTSGIAFDVDDGSGPIRVLVGSATGIDLSPWESGARLDLVGIVGQRDSSGTGTAGYRVMPRDPADVLAVDPGSASPSPSASGSTPPSPTASAEPADLITIQEARSLPRNARARVRGVVTLPTGLIDDASAVIQDGSGAILLRIGDEVGSLALGERIEVAGTRSTKGGMESIRVTQPPLRLGAGSPPGPLVLRTRDAAETHEARLVVVRGALVANARKASSGSVSFEIDDGSGPLRIAITAALDADRSELLAGAWVEVTGVLGQETTGSQPLRGYRVWPRSVADIRLVAATTDVDRAGGGDSEEGTAARDATAALGDLDGAAIDGLRVGATLVLGPWPELGLGGLLWDGSRLVAIDTGSSERLTAAIGRRRPPVPLELEGLRRIGTDPSTGLSVMSLGREVDDVIVGDGTPDAPRSSLSAGARPAWVAVVAPVSGPASRPTLNLGQLSARIDLRCDEPIALPTGAAGISGVALDNPARILVPCGGVRAAPRLSGDSRPVSAGRSAGVAAGPDAAVDPETVDVRRAVAAGLLAIAALAIVAGAVAWRRLLPEQPDDEAAMPADDPADEAADPPRLTLVGLPREHSP